MFPFGVLLRFVDHHPCGRRTITVLRVDKSALTLPNAPSIGALGGTNCVTYCYCGLRCFKGKTVRVRLRLFLLLAFLFLSFFENCFYPRASRSRSEMNSKPRRATFLQFGEGPDRQEWFPMVIVIEVMEAGADDESEDVTVQYEVSVDVSRLLIS